MAAEDSPKKQRTFVGCLFKLLATGAVIVASVVTVLMVIKLRNDANFARAMQEAKADGWPTNAAEFDAFYAVPEGASDVTSLLREVCVAIEDPSFKVAAVSMPFLGSQGPANVPPPGVGFGTEAATMKFVDQQGTLIQKLHQLIEQPSVAARFPLNSSAGFQMDVRELQTLRNAARLLTLHARMMARKGDLKAATDSILALRKLADCVNDVPLLVSGLIGIAIESMGVDTYKDLAATLQAEPAQIDRLFEQGKQRDFSRLLSRTIAGEQAISASVTGSSMMSLVMGKDRVFWAHVTNRILAHSDEPVHEAIPKLRDILDEAETKLQSSKSNPLAAISLPSYKAYINAVARADAMSKAMQVLLAVQRFKIKNGEMPQNANDLEPEFLTKLLIDSYDGKPIRLIVRDSTAIAYSVGDDLVDDQGAGPVGPDYSVTIQIP